MAFTSSDLTAIDAAIASGELTVEQGGRRVTYRSVAELLAARRQIAASIAEASSSGLVTQSFASFCRD